MTTPMPLRPAKTGEIHILLKRAGVVPNRRLGQNFLTDANFTDWIVRESGAAPGKRIVEVGPGFGVLTKRMLACGADVAAVEFDHRLVEWLSVNLVPKEHLKIVEGDACRTDLNSLFPGEEYSLVSNLPYSAGTVVVANQLELERPPREMLIMLQKEVAQRLCADSGSDAYGSISVRAAAAYETELLRIAPPELFYPRPEVESAVIRMKRRENLPPRAFRLALSRFVRLGFSQRRKKMIKQLAGVYGRGLMEKIYSAVGISPDVRAEHVTAAQFMKMAELVPPELR